MARSPKAWIRRRLIARLREAVTGAGGVWIRLAPFPYPYRSAFSFRADLDEPVPDDYHRFARGPGASGRMLHAFCEHHAYAHHPSVLADLRQHDTQSHGHFHHVYREPEANRANLERAHRILWSAGFEPVAFASPHGRWRRSLDDQLEDLGYLYSSEFQLGHDDFPFFPWKGNRFSRILQIPIHPVCEGLFLEAGRSDPADHRRLFPAGRRRQARCRRAGRGLWPSRAQAGADARGHGRTRAARSTAHPLVWRATFTDLARWWRWRGERRWMALPRDDNRLEIQFDDWDPQYQLRHRDPSRPFHCSIPVTGSAHCRSGSPAWSYERTRTGRRTGSILRPIDRETPSLKRAMRTALDWETVTPLDDIPRSSISNRLKRGLRWWKHKRAGATA